MKKTSKQAIALTITYILLWFIGFSINAFLNKSLPELLKPDVFLYHIFLGLISFFKWLPSILLSIFLIDFSLFFRHTDLKNYGRFSVVQMKNYKKVLLIASICVTFIFVCSEIFTPLSINAKNQLEKRTDDYNWAIKKAQESFELDNVSSALFYIESALRLNPTAQEAGGLKEKYERFSAENQDMVQDLSFENSLLSATITTMPDDPDAAEDLLTQAHTAFTKQDYFNAHYYATLALKMSGPNNPNTEEMQGIAVTSWDNLSKWAGFQPDDSSQFFALKQKAYTALMNGEILTAYYAFHDLSTKNNFDPDIARFYQLAIQGLQKEYFFIDETFNLAHFENESNIEFSLNRPDGGQDKIKIGGITAIKNTGNSLKYLRDYSFSSYDSEGKLLYTYSVPYAKLIGEQASIADPNYAQTYNIKNPNTLVPRLLLTSVDRTTPGIVSAPIYESGIIEPPKNTMAVLPLTLADFNLIGSAALGPKYMDIASLFQFVPKADTYGFSSQVYGAFLIQRISYPFLLFALFIFLAIQAWNFRLTTSVQFKFIWIFIFPAFTALTQLVFEVIDYGISLVYFSLAHMTGYWQIAASVGIFLLIIIALSIRFLSLHTENSNQ